MNQSYLFLEAVQRADLAQEKKMDVQRCDYNVVVIFWHLSH